MELIINKSQEKKRKEKLENILGKSKASGHQI